MKTILSTAAACLVIAVSGLKMADLEKLSFVGGSCDTCQDGNTGEGCCDEGAKPTDGAGCNGGGGTTGTATDCNGAKGKWCADSGIEQTKACNASASEECPKGYSYTCKSGKDSDGNATPFKWVKGEKDANCGNKQLCSMTGP